MTEDFDEFDDDDEEPDNDDDDDYEGSDDWFIVCRSFLDLNG